MAFLDSEKADIRRFCGYPAYGGTPQGFQNWRFYQTYGLLEFRMSNLSSDEEAIVRRYLSNLAVLETAIPMAAQNLDTDQAAVWTRNREEVEQRTSLFDDWRRRLCAFFGLPPGPGLASPGVTLVV
jgi:hypothetical protein